MFLGLDPGTSAVKAVLVDAAGVVRASASHPLTVSHPKPLWSEQAPADWWLAAQSAIEQVLAVAGREGISARSVAAIGLSGQVHGATVLDANAQMLRPAILWNDGTFCVRPSTSALGTPCRLNTLQTMRSESRTAP